ncbi:peptidoglycan-binding domain-containing protein [Cellulomonas soli]
MTTGGRSPALTGFLLVALVAPVLIGGALILAERDRSPLLSAADPEPLVAAVERATRSRDMPVAVAVTREDALSPRTDATGVLTGVRVAPGTPVDTGTVVVTVGDGDVVAYRSERPLSQDVAAGSTGGSVAVAQQLLVDLGLFAGPVDGKVGPTTLRAIRAFNLAHGYGTSSALALASLSWIGSEPVAVDQVEVRVGAVVEPGTALYTTRTGLVGVTASTGAALPEGDLVLEVADLSAPFDRSAWMATDSDFTAAVALSLGDQDEGSGTLRLATPVDVGTVPTSAVVTDVDGTMCFFPSVGATPVVVTPTGGSLGTTDVPVDLVGDPVLVNPRAVRDDLTCDL